MLVEHRSRDRRCEGKWPSPKRSQTEPCASDRHYESASGRTVQPQSGRFKKNHETSPRPAEKAWALPAIVDFERLQDELKQRVPQPWPSAKSGEPRVRSSVRTTWERRTYETAPLPRSSGTIAATVKEVTPHEVVAVAHGPSGREEEFRLPLSLFARQPLRGTRITVVVPQEAEPTPSHDQGESGLDNAYAELDALLAERHVHGPNPDLEQRIEMAWAHLDALQEAACTEVQKELDASLAIPLDELEQMLADVHAQLAEDDE